MTRYDQLLTMYKKASFAIDEELSRPDPSAAVLQSCAMLKEAVEKEMRITFSANCRVDMARIEA
jgi:hypothetical protein